MRCVSNVRMVGFEVLASSFEPVCGGCVFGPPTDGTIYAGLVQADQDQGQDQHHQSKDTHCSSGSGDLLLKGDWQAW